MFDYRVRCGSQPLVSVDFLRVVQFEGLAVVYIDICAIKGLPCILPFSYEPGHEKMCPMPYANNKGADQPAHPRSLISAFVVRSSFCNQNFKPHASFCGCAGRFESDLVGNSLRHVLSCRVSYVGSAQPYKYNHYRANN